MSGYVPKAQLSNCNLIAVSHAGQPGDDGSRWWDGSGQPNPATLPDADPIDYYLDNASGDIYRLDASPFAPVAWQPIYKLMLPTNQGA